MPQYGWVLWKIGYFLAQYGTYIKAALVVASTAYSINSSQQQKKRMRRAIEDAQGVQQVVRDAVMPRCNVYGRRRVSGQLTFFHEYGNNREYMAMVIALTTHEIDAFEALYFDDDLLTRNSDGSITGKYAGKAWIHLHKGEPGQLANGPLQSVAPGKWTADHKLSGCAYVVVVLRFDQEVFQGGIPNFSAVIRGKKLYDPRDGQTRWSANPALICYDYMRDSLIGLNRPASSISEASVIEAANICDEDVSLDAGGTENRYEAHAYVDSSTLPEDNLQPILAAMAGDIVRSSGKWFIRAGAYVAPDLDLTEADMLSGIDVQPRLAKRQLCNCVSATFVSPAADYNETTTAEIKNSMYLAEDNGERLPRTLRFPVVTSYTQTQRLQKIELERTRQQISASVKIGPKGLVLKPGDTVRLTLPNLGWSAKVFEVSTWKLNVMPDESGQSALSVELGLRETHSSVWAWSAEETTYDPAPDTDLPDPSIVQPPTGFAVNGDSFLQSDGSFNLAAKLTWTSPADAYVLSGGRILIEYKPHAATDWIQAGSVEGSALSAIIHGIRAGTAYDYRVRSVNYLRIPSGWVNVDNRTLTGDLSGPSAPTGVSAVAGAGIVTLDWDDNTEADLSEYFVYRGTTSSTGSMTKIAEVGSSRFIDSLVTAGTAYYYAIKAYDNSDNPSSFSSVASATPTAGGGGGMTSYFHVAYASNSSGTTGFNFTSGKYIGTYSDFTATASTDPADYSWKMFQGDNAYLHVKYSNDGGLSFTSPDGETPGKFIGTYSDSSPTDSTNVSSYTWASLNQKNTTAPSNPGTLTKTGDGSYLSGDGTSFGYMLFTVPALPSGAAFQNIVMKTGTGSYMVVGQLTNTSTLTGYRIDDLTPTKSYDMGLIAYNEDGEPSAVVMGTGSPYSATGDTTAPAAPSNVHATRDGVVPKFFPGTRTYMMGVRFTWDNPTDKDFSHIEYKKTSYNDSAESAPIFNIGPVNEFIAYSNIISGFFWFRSKDWTGNTSAWVSTPEVAASYQTLGTGTIASEDKDNARVTGIMTGSGGSVKKVLVHQPAGAVFNVGYGTQVDYAVDISGCGFSTKPDGGKVQAIDGNCQLWGAAYNYDHGGNSSSTAWIKVWYKDGTAMNNGTVRVSCDFIEYD